MKLIRFVWANRKAVLTLTMIVCLVGAYFAAHLPVAIFPQLVVPRIVISADAGDIPIETTLVQVTRPLEAAVSTIPGVTKVSSTTTRGSNGLDVTFAWGTDMQAALQRVQGQIAEVRGSLPANADVTAAPINPSIFPIMGYSLSSKHYDLAALRHTAIYTLRPRLARLAGVAQVRVTGGDVPEFLVSVRPDALAARGLSLQDVQDALSKANGVASVGTFDSAYQRYEVVVSGLLHSASDIGDVTVASHGDAKVPIAVSDVATVTQSVRQPTVLATGNGAPCVVVNIIKQPDANTIQVADEVRATIAELQKSLPAGMGTSLFYDQSEIVRQSESSVIESIVIGGSLALVVLVLFLGNLRAASIVLLILPLSLLITFALMRALGETLNIMTLGALAIALGLVIDDGIVVVENIVHEIEMGHSIREAIAAGLQAITPAMVGSSLTTMAAFLPLTFLNGVTGQFFAPLALVMISTLGVSLVLALALAPLLAAFMLSARKESAPTALDRFAGFFPSLVDRLASGYERLLTWCLRKRAWVIALTIPIMAGSYLLFSHLQTGFFPEFDEGAFVIDYQMPAGTSLAETDRVCSRIETLLGKVPEIASWSRLTGARSGSGLELTEPSQGDILVRLKDQRERGADDIMSDVRNQIAATQPAMQVDIIQMLQDGIGDIAGSPQPIEVKIYGDDTAVLAALAHKTGDIVSKTPGVVDENDGIVDTGPQIAVRVDSQRASRYGLTTADVTTAAMTALRGSVATTVQQGEEGVDVRVRAKGVARAATDVPSLANVMIATHTGANVPLEALAAISAQPGTPQITRENQQQMVAVTARLEGRDLGSGVKDVQARIAKSLNPPPGYRVEYGGLYASQQDSFTQLAIVLLLAVLLVTTMLIIQLRSLRQAVVLLVAAILSMSGVLVGLFVTRTPLNISSFTGAIMIVGIVTENGIVLFDFVNQLRRQDHNRPLREIMAEAGRKRLRPILMTTIGAILALLPLALGLGAGAAMQKPLAIAVIGGLSGSMLFTLIIAPCLFVAAEVFAARHRGPDHDEFLPATAATGDGI